MDLGLATPVLATLAFWWVSTGVILLLGERSHRTRHLAMASATLMSFASLLAVVALRDNTGPLAAYLGALSGLVIWAWHEMSFLFGLITGPNKGPCAPGLSGWSRFRAASATLIHHEIALAGTLVVLVILSLGAANAVAMQTFALLFVLRLSSKLNLFLGAPHFTDQFLPRRLAYLRTYFSKAVPGPFFFLTTLAIAGSAGGLIWAATKAPTGFEAASLALLGALAALGALEHLFMALPLPDAALWRWLLSPRDPRRTPD